MIAFGCEANVPEQPGSSLALTHPAGWDFLGGTPEQPVVMALVPAAPGLKARMKVRLISLSAHQAIHAVYHAQLTYPGDREVFIDILQVGLFL